MTTSGSPPETAADETQGGDKSPPAPSQPASIVIVSDGMGQVLTVSRPEPPHEMAFPGGHQEPGEDAMQAAARELLEETGVKASGLRHVADLTSPTDGRPVHVYRATEWTGQPRAGEPNTRIAWMTPSQLRDQAVLYRPTVEALMSALKRPTTARDGGGTITMDLAVGDVHQGSAEPPHRLDDIDDGGDGEDVEMSISAAKRDSLKSSQFAWPEERKFPIDTPARIRNAAARLEQQKSKLPAETYKRIRGRIARAAKRAGIESEYNASDKTKSGRNKLDRAKSIHVRADLAVGGSLHVRHMSQAFSDDGRQAVIRLRDGSVGFRDIRPIRQGEEVDPTQAGIHLIGPSTWKDGTPKKLVWVQLAEVGAWKGHVSGPFELTPGTFSEITRNFEKRGLPIPWDYEHFSEQAAPPPGATENGTPAPAWVHQLDNRGVGGLWGLTEFLEKARNQIHEGEYAFLSPAIRFGTKDPVSGQPAGAKLTSVALTNQPFLTGLDQLRAAKDADAVNALQAPLMAAARFEVQMSNDATLLGDADRLLHRPASYMPAIKQALKLHELAPMSDVSDQLDRLRDMCMGDESAEGVNLDEYMQPLGDLIGAAPGMSVGELLDRIEKLIDAAIAEHEIRDHSGAAAMRDAPPAETEETIMSATDPNVIALKDAQEKAKGLEGQLAAKDGEVKALNEKVSARDQLLTAKDQEITALTEKVSARDTLLTSKQGEIDALQKRVDEQAVALKSHAEAEEKRVVGERHLTYKDTKKMSEESMLALFRSDRALFDKEFPAIDPDKRHLLSSVTPPAPPGQAPTSAGNSAAANVVQLCVEKLMKERKLNLSDARVEADAMIRRGEAEAFLKG